MSITGTNYVGEVVRIADLFAVSDMVTAYSFRDCMLIGPVVAMFVDGCTLVDCTFEGDINAILWRPPGDFIVGGVAFAASEFVGCRFSRVGICGPDETLARIAGALNKA